MFTMIACGTDNPNPNNDSGNGFDDLFVGDYGKPGLYEKDGTPHQQPTPNQVTGKTINVLDHGAVPNDENVDNTAAFKRAENSAEPGDEIYVPNGTYYFKSYAATAGSYYSHIYLHEGVNLRGESEENTILVSNFNPTLNEKNSTSVITTLSSNVVISNLTVTSLTSDNDLPDPNSSNTNSNVFTAPKYGITVDNDEPIEIVSNVLIKNVTVEKFIRMGVRIASSRDVVVDSCTFQKAVDLGGGGAGYGVTIQGRGNGINDTDSTLDPVFNVVKNSRFIGDYLRHGVIIQYYGHNNLIEGNYFENILLDSIDLHGEDEYSNEICNNTIINTRAGAGIGVGNSGATHDGSGPNNFFHDNIIDGGARGIDVILGSHKTILYKNTIKNLTKDNTIAITLSDAHHTRIIENTIENITGKNSIAIKITYSFYPLNPAAGIPDGYKIKGNTFKNIVNGVYVETRTDNFVFKDNTFTTFSGYDLKEDKDKFVLPSITDEVIEKHGTFVLPTDNNFITTEAKNVVQTQKNMKFKCSVSEPEYNRMIYAKFDLTTEITPVVKKVYLTFAAKSKDGKINMNFYGSTNYLDWTEDTITWNNSKLHNPIMARIMTEDGDYTAEHIRDFQIPIVGQEFKTYYLDITDYVMNLETKLFTLIICNNSIDEMYAEIYSSKQTAAGQTFGIILAQEPRL